MRVVLQEPSVIAGYDSKGYQRGSQDWTERTAR